MRIDVGPGWWKVSLTATRRGRVVVTLRVRDRCRTVRVVLGPRGRKA